jgi:hypothetical protein
MFLFNMQVVYNILISIFYLQRKSNRNRLILVPVTNQLRITNYELRNIYGRRTKQKPDKEETGYRTGI